MPDCGYRRLINAPAKAGEYISEYFEKQQPHKAAAHMINAARREKMVKPSDSCAMMSLFLSAG